LYILHSSITPDFVEDPIEIADLYLEFFHSYFLEDYYEDYLLMMLEIIIEGLNSSDLEYKWISKKFVKYIFAILCYVHTNWLPEFYEKHDEEVILEFLKKVYANGAKEIIDPYLEKLSQAYQNAIVSGFK